jgi:hypothetical protein
VIAIDPRAISPGGTLVEASARRPHSSVAGGLELENSAKSWPLVAITLGHTTLPDRACDRSAWRVAQLASLMLAIARPSPHWSALDHSSRTTRRLSTNWRGGNVGERAGAVC